MTFGCAAEYAQQGLVKKRRNGPRDVINLVAELAVIPTTGVLSRCGVQVKSGYWRAHYSALDRPGNQKQHIMEAPSEVKNPLRRISYCSV